MTFISAFITGSLFLIRITFAQPGLHSEKPLRLGLIQADPAVPVVGSLLTLHIDLEGTWKTPFWQEEISVSAEIQGPGGRNWVVPGFYTQDYIRSMEKSKGGPVEVLTPVGKPEWQIRFLPNFTGNYQVTVRAADHTGQVDRVLNIRVSGGIPRPYIHVSGDDPHYFEFGNGEPYFANGLNVCFARGDTQISEYEKWFGEMGNAGMNYARLWMRMGSFGFEWGKPGEYQLEPLWRMDQVLKLAEENGIYIKLCLENFRRFSENNPYSGENGGPCETVLDVFRNDEAKRMWKNRLRYAVARWGWSPNIMAWEFWNEIDAVQGYDKTVVQPWTREMARYLDQIDPVQHMHVNSLGSFVYEPGLWKMPEMDFAQMHGYWKPDWISAGFGKDLAQTLADRIAMLRPFQKPCFFAEFGLVDNTWGYSPKMDVDTLGVNMHNGMWAAMMAGSAGCGHLWWWDNYVARYNLWHHFRGLANFVAGVPWNTEGFEPFSAGNQNEQLRVYGLRGKTMTLLWVQNRAHTWWNVVEGNPVPTVEHARIFHPEFACQESNTYTVEIWDAYDGKKISSREVRVDGESQYIDIGKVEKDVAVKVILK